MKTKRSINDIISRQGYCRNNNIVLNCEKTEMILFSLKDLGRSILVTVHNKAINQNISVKYLGITCVLKKNACK